MNKKQEIEHISYLFPTSSIIIATRWTWKDGTDENNVFTWNKLHVGHAYIIETVLS